MVVLFVGPQASGKSTRARTYGRASETNVIVSQDLMGKDHFEFYKRALATYDPHSTNIIIDRINHTREQRKKYVDEAKRAGWETTIVAHNEPFGLCLDRAVKRKDHPTINNKETAIQALRMYFSQYERPTLEEADYVNYMTAYDPYLLDLNNLYPAGTRAFIIGDVHGCFDEVMELLEKNGYQKGVDVVIFVGDMIDRGPKIKEVLEFAMNTPRVHSVMGNHENKFARWLAIMGAKLVNKIRVGNGLQETIDQCQTIINDESLLSFLWSLPMIIKFGDNYIFHAGLNPRFAITRQNREFLLYARLFNPETNSFDDEGSPEWYKHEIHPTLKNTCLFFGHNVHEIIDPLHYANFQKNKNIFPMDGGCVFGGNLNGCIVQNNSLIFITTPSKQPKTEEEPMYTHWSQPYEERVAAGYLSKSETEDLVLYNYSDKCTFEKKWDKYTLECRGLIFEKASGLVVARPFPKFFNVGESEGSQLHNLPKEEYECFEKMDGSLGIVFNYKGKWQVATRGSFHSEQAKQAQSIMDEFYNMEGVDHSVTLLTEIVYPENRHNKGSRLVIDYGSKKMLVLLASYNNSTGQELERSLVQFFSGVTNMPLVAKFDHTIQKMIEMQKTLPADKEGFVVRFKSGLRVKIKGKEYMRMHKILNSITPLNIWEMMSESKDFSVPGHYLAQIPEEYTEEVLDIVHKLKAKRDAIVREVYKDFDLALSDTGLLNCDPKSKEAKKAMGLYITKGPANVRLKHPSMMFAVFNHAYDKLEEYCRKMSRPKMNQL